MGIENPIERAVLMQKLVRNFKENYMKKWVDTVKKSPGGASTPQEAKEQIDELYIFMKKLREENESPSKKFLLKKVKKAVEEKKYSPELRQMIMDELAKLEDLNESQHEFQLIKEFLELVSDLPYGTESKDIFDLKKAKEILDGDHFGMEKVKSKILEFIAVAKMRGTTKGKSLLLVGPPGTGKTSIASSIAKCLGRQFIRISLGGENDVALIKGHRKTYVGAYPGKLVLALEQAKTENPVILLDEVDKIAVGYKGNIQDTLLEVLDPAQNHNFRDNFLEAPVDLSKVLFICSANLTDTISEPLLDRMEVIELSGYTANEKKMIAKNYLIPKNLKSKGLDKEDFKVQLQDEALEFLIDRYAREAGVRNLEKKISRIFEKICLSIVKSNQKEYAVKKDDIKGYVGPPIFSSDRLYPHELPRGVSIGLSYSAYGGGVLFIETAKSSFPKGQVSNPQEAIKVTATAPEGESQNGAPVGGAVKTTGQLGKVMKESTEIAHTYAKAVCHEYFNNKYLEENNIHIHFPEGASKKDGPSAGITITTALISLATGVPVRGDTGMTGEISLNGRILKIGGLREKVLAAKREGLTRILVPASNEIDVEEMKDEVKQGVDFIFVKDYDQVLDQAFVQPLSARSVSSTATASA